MSRFPFFHCYLPFPSLTDELSFLLGGGKLPLLSGRIVLPPSLLVLPSDDKGPLFPFADGGPFPPVVQTPFLGLLPCSDIDS